MILISTLISFMCATALALPLSSNPLTLGILILLTALLLSSIFASSISSWLAFLIFLIYIGGILVIFSYFVSVIPNQTLSINQLKFMTITFIILTILSQWFLLTPIIKLSTPQIKLIYTSSNIPMLIFLASTLFLIIVIVVKISSQRKGPLRSFTKYV